MMMKEGYPMKRASIAALAVLVTSAATGAHAAAVDLSGWTAEGDGSWTVQPGDDSVLQTINGAPTVFHAGGNSQGQSLAGEITVTTIGDDDFIGFVLGYQAGDLGSASSQYILIDWKQANQDVASVGLAVSLVQGTGPGVDFWAHSGVVSEVARGATLGSTGWADNAAYAFDLEFTSNRVRVFVDGGLEIDITAADAGLGSFADGAFGFYNYSQPSVLYAGVTEDVLPPSAVPVPGAAPLLLSGLAGIALMRRRRRNRG
jgi:hypothetical protein